jgi:propionyl-CoA carboxylase alpha chain
MIRRVLVANRGAAARRVFATCRLLGIETVAVYSDADAGSPHAAEADWAVHLPGRAPTATYLRGDLIIAAAHKSGADAVHPGWGFLSTDPDFARAVADGGLTWIGPPAKTLTVLSDKLAVAATLAEAGIDVLPRYADPSEVDDFPVLVKPVRGGGRGIRLARTADRLPEAVTAARREAALAYGDGGVYCEKYVSPARHLDVQVIVDAHGNTVSFGEREGSLQRQHQQLVAESPSPVVPPELRERLIETAVGAATALGYVGAATVELLLAMDGTCYLLELSPRLPAEHAVTECLAGLDLVRLQLLVAEGAPLPFTGSPPMRGHAIGVQLRAEDPAYAWRPGTGTLHRFAIGPVADRFKPLPAPGLRLDAGTADGCEIGTHYDSALAHLVAWAPSRYEAARLLATSLARSHLHGVVTNRDLLVRVLRSPTFLAGAVDTAFLDDHPEVFAPLLSSVEGGRLSCLAAALAAAAARRAGAPALGSLASGWRNVPSGAQTAVYAGPMGTVEIGYRLGRTGELVSWWGRVVDPDELDLAGLGQPSSLPDDHPPVAVMSAGPEQVVLDVAGVRLAFAIHRVGSVTYVDSVEGSVVLNEVPRYPIPVPLDESPA